MPIQNLRIDDAVHNTVRESTLEPKQIAAEIGLTHQMLLNKTARTDTRHNLHLAEAVALINATRDYRIIEAMAASVGGIFTAGLGPDAGLAPNLMGDVAKMSAEFGQLMQEIATDLTDGTVDDDELARIELEAGQLRSALNVLIRDLRTANERGRQAA